MEGIRFAPAGDRALVIEFGDRIDEKINERVQQAAIWIRRKKDAAITEVVPSFCSVLVHYDPVLRRYGSLCRWLEELLKEMPKQCAEGKRILKVPVCYGARFGADLGDMEKLLGMDRDEIIAIHSRPDYRIYMLGFLPGFVYLGGLDERIACPRLPSPRVKIAPGAVGIGGSQTGIYPMASPGGWRLIGQTPINMYDPQRKEPILVRAGDYIRFVPVGLEEWYDIKREVTLGKYRPEIVEEGQEERKAAERERIEIRREDTNADSSCAASMRLIITDGGALTTVQDRGRFGSQETGITQSGAMDQEAYRLANRLVENDGDEAVLEMTVTGASFRIEGKGLIAVTGADMNPQLNGRPMAMNQAAAVKTGDVFESGFAVNGCRSYLAVSGGIGVPKVLGSCSTNIRCGMGGLQGRAVRAGDVLECAQRAIVIGEKRLGVPWEPYKTEITLRFVPGPQADRFSEETMRAFQSAVYRLDEKSDRMGCRLDGPPLQAVNGVDIISDGIVFGSIQVPANGKPIVLMADHQTTGGYAKIGTVIQKDLWKLAQLIPGGKVHFQAIPVEEAQKIG